MTPGIAARQASLSITNSRSLPKTHVHRVEKWYRWSYLQRRNRDRHRLFLFQMFGGNGYMEWLKFFLQFLMILTNNICCCSVSVVSNSLQPHGLQHTRLPLPSLSPGVCSNSCPLNPWCHPTISFSVAVFSSCPQSFPASGSFPMNQLFISRGRNIEASASASALLMNIQGWFCLGLTDLISLQSKVLSSFLQHHSSKASILWHSVFFMV